MTPVAEQPYLWRIKHPLRCRYRTYARASIAHGTRHDASVRAGQARSSPYSPVCIQRGLFSARIGPKGKAARRCIVRGAKSETASEESPEVLRSCPCRVCPLLTYGIAAPHHLTITNPPSPADPRLSHAHEPFPIPRFSKRPGRSTNLAKSLFSRFFACCDKLDQAIAGYIHTTQPR